MNTTIIIILVALIIIIAVAIVFVLIKGKDSPDSSDESGSTFRERHEAAQQEGESSEPQLHTPSLHQTEESPLQDLTTPQTNPMGNVEEQTPAELPQQEDTTMQPPPMQEDVNTVTPPVMEEQATNDLPQQEDTINTDLPQQGI